MKETEKVCRKEIRKLENPANASEEQDSRGRKLKFGSNFTKKTKRK